MDLCVCDNGAARAEILHDQTAARSEDLISAKSPAVHPGARNQIGKKPSVLVNSDQGGAQFFKITAFDMKSAPILTHQFPRVAAVVSDDRSRMHEGFKQAARTLRTDMSEQHDVARSDQ